MRCSPGSPGLRSTRRPCAGNRTSPSGASRSCAWRSVEEAPHWYHRPNRRRRRTMGFLDQAPTLGLDIMEMFGNVDHAEGICVAPDGTTYVSGEAGQIYRV